MRVAIYARVSTDRGEQDPEVQISALTRWLEAQSHEVSEVYTDLVSGSKRSRPALDSLLSDVPGKFDAVAVVKLDRLARSTKDLIEIAGQLEAEGVDLMVKDQQIDTSTPAGKLMFHVLGAIAEFERDLIIERTKAGLEHARNRGVRLGRPVREIDLARARRLVNELGTVAAAARAMGVPRKTLADRLAA